MTNSLLGRWVVVEWLDAAGTSAESSVEELRREPVGLVKETSGVLVAYADDGLKLAASRARGDHSRVWESIEIPRGMILAEPVELVRRRARCGKGQQKPESGAAKAPDETQGGAK